MKAAISIVTAADDVGLTAAVERVLRYWSARRVSARLVPAATVTACVRRGLLSWVAPLAQSLPGRETGAAVPFQGGGAEIVAIEP